MLQYLTNTQKGILFIIGGSIILLHTMGFLAKGLDIIIIVSAIGMIIYGFILADYYDKVKKLIGSQKNKEK